MTWWTSTFNHLTKRQRFDSSRIIEVLPGRNKFGCYMGLAIVRMGTLGALFITMSYLRRLSWKQHHALNPMWFFVVCLLWS